MSEDPSYDAGSEVAENNAKRDEARHGRDDLATFRRLMGHPNGRAFVYRLLLKCRMRWEGGTPFQAGQPDTTAYYLGMQAIGNVLLGFCDAVPDLYMQMLAEARKDEERIVLLRAEEAKKQAAEDDAVTATQGIDLPPPKGWPGHLSVVPPGEGGGSDNG